MVEAPAGAGRTGSASGRGVRMDQDVRDKHIGSGEVPDERVAGHDRLSRRGLLAAAGGAAVGAAVGAVAPGAGAEVAVAAPVPPAGPQPTAFGPVSVRPGDLRYENLLRGNNFRYVGRPDEIRV